MMMVAAKTSNDNSDVWITDLTTRGMTPYAGLRYAVYQGSAQFPSLIGVCLEEQAARCLLYTSDAADE